MKHIMVFCLTVLINLASSSTVLADIKTDELAGKCWAYLIASKNEAGANAAINMADNQERAANFGLNWLKTLKRYQNDKAASDGMIFEASSACRKVGIRPADYN